MDQAMQTGATSLLIACQEGLLEVAKLLSSYGASRAATPTASSKAKAGAGNAATGATMRRAPEGSDDGEGTRTTSREENRRRAAHARATT